MQTIHTLPESIIAKIAAGEVIERPAYAVKELVENAIDAHADYIQIILEDAGLKKLMIIDNGDGMSKEDIMVCFKHHTTSKISAKENLIGIKSLGFRGEALSSIASVSHMTIKSKTKRDQSGTVIVLHSGKIIKNASTGMPAGTTVIVENIFSDIPARKKFLKSSRAELRNCLEIILPITLAYPYIRFQCIHNKKILFDFPKTTIAHDRIKELLGEDIYEQLTPVHFEKEHISLNGFLSKPHIASTSTQKQYIFINNRHISDKRISQTVKEGYGTMLDSSSFPISIIFLQIPHEMVDVNVHPRKEQVSFLNDQILYSVLKEATQKALQITDVRITSPWDNQTFSNTKMPDNATSILRDEIASWDLQSITRILKTSDLIQMHKVYLITQSYNGIIFIDQHAAHERIIYEKLYSAYQNQKKTVKSISLKNTSIIKLSLTDKQILTEHKKIFDDLRIIFEDFGDKAIKITHVPIFFKDHNIGKIITEVITDISAGIRRDIDSQSHTMITYLACRTAVKAGDTLTKKQAKEIIEQLENTPNNKTCPHGRPTKVEIILRSIHKLFKR